VLNCIRAQGEASRTDIAAALKLSPATVTFVTSGLMAGGLIEEISGLDAPEAAKRGRPRVALRLTQGQFHIAGIKVSRDRMSILILDFDGREVVHWDVDLLEPRMTPTALVLAIRDGVTAACAEIDGGIDALAGISIGLAGQVDATNRFVHWSSSLTERNIAFGALLDEYLPCAAFVENDANLVAKAEQLFGEARGLNNFLVVTVEHGVGLLQRAGKELGQGAVDTVRALVKTAANGSDCAAKILDEAGEVFGLGLSNLINLFDPERIILSGAEHRIAHLHSDEVLAQVRASVVKVDAPLPDIHVHHWDDLKWARGAAAMGIEHVSALKVKELA